MQRTISAILMTIGTLIGIFIIVMKIADGETNDYHFYLLLIGLLMLFVGGWYNYYRNRTKEVTE